jgi:DNA-binding NtrC family response regulator
MGAKHILIVDDCVSVHRDFAKILAPYACARAAEPARLEGQMFELAPAQAAGPADFNLSFGLSGEEALRILRREASAGRLFAMAFVDMRMPPGWNGLETVEHLWSVQPCLEIAICSAYSDYSWHSVIQRLNRPGIRLVQKPLGTSDVRRVAHELCGRGRLIAQHLPPHGSPGPAHR